MAKKKEVGLRSVESLCQESRLLYEELRRESDRGAALVGAAFLDEALGRMLRRFFVDEAEIVNSLLSGESNGPLSSFAARTKLAYCLGLLGKEMYEDLTTIRRIRNDFAHEHRNVSFEEQSVQDRCKKLKQWLKLELGPEWMATSRDCFLVAVSQLANQLLLRALSLDHAAPGEDFMVDQRIKT